MDSVFIMIVTGYFQAMITYQNYKPPLSAPEKYWFFCDDSYYNWKPTPAKAVLDGWQWPNDKGKTRLQVESNCLLNTVGAYRLN